MTPKVRTQRVPPSPSFAVLSLSGDDATFIAHALRRHRAWARSVGLALPESLAQFEAFVTAKATAMVRERQAVPTLANPVAGVHDQFVEPVALTFSAAAVALSVSRSTLTRMVKRGEVGVVVIGGAKRIPTHEIERLIGANNERSAE